MSAAVVFDTLNFVRNPRNMAVGGGRADIFPKDLQGVQVDDKLRDSFFLAWGFWLMIGSAFNNASALAATTIKGRQADRKAKKKARQTP